MISQNRYVRIVSGVGGGAGVRTRQLIMRVITTSNKISPSEIKEFTTPDAVTKFFGDGSEESKRALRYFKFISKSVNAPNLMSFVRWVDQQISAGVRGPVSSTSLADFKGVSAGTMQINVNGTIVQVSEIDLSAATDLTNVATLITTLFAGSTVTDPVLKNSTFSYNTATQSYAWLGAAGLNTVSFVATGSINDVAGMMGLSSADAVVTSGQNQETLAACASRTTAIDNNFGSIVVAYGANAGTDPKAPGELAAWNAAQNNMYMLSVAVESKWLKPSNIVDTLSQFVGKSGCGVTDAGVLTDYNDQIPCEILAATDYTAPNATQNYMYYQFADRTSTVSDDDQADLYDANRVNYIGTTQTGGQKLAFYQRGTLQGGPNDAVDMNIYANEMWLKDYIGAQFMSAFLSLPTVPANDVGRAMLISVLQGACDLAKYNATFSVGKELNVTQQLYITQITGDKMAWHQVQTLGYWFSVDFLPETTKDGRTEYYAKYVLVYGKDDAIRRVEGQDVLI